MFNYIINTYLPYKKILNNKEFTKKFRFLEEILNDRKSKNRKSFVNDLYRLHIRKNTSSVE